ncbi:MAG: hypothetical protein CR988_06940 [Treponema sp.]|nr:MAG: hypothetical protein CR988_06940 [Treponema sp.]
MKKSFLLMFSVFFILLCSCSQSNPEILKPSVKLLKAETQSGLLVERLSVFLEYEDDDGQIDFRTINIIHIPTGLKWTIMSNDVSFFTFRDFSENRFVVGTNKIAPPLYKMPLGEYHIAISDLGHNEHSFDYTLEELNADTTLPFEIEVNDNKCILKSKMINRFFNEYNIILLGADRQAIIIEKNKLLDNGAIPIMLHELKKKYPNARYFQIMFEQPKIAFLSKIYDIGEH